MTRSHFDFPSLRTIAVALGGEVHGSQVVAPGPGHSRRDRSLGVRLSPDAPDGFLAFSYAGDDWRLCRDHVFAKLGIERERWSPRVVLKPRVEQTFLSDDDDERVAASVSRIVNGMVPLVGTLGERFLRDGRQIDTAAISDVLDRVDAVGWHPAVYFHQPDHQLHGHRLGCVVVVMTDVVTARPTGAISRTYIAPDGHKVGKAKTLGTPAGIVRLSRDEDVCAGLFLAEGLETAVAAMSIGLRPVWSTGSVALMASFPILAGIEAITIIADHDEKGAGQRAAAECAQRWIDAGRDARVLMLDRVGDLNDGIRGVA